MLVDGTQVHSLGSGKADELFCYLLIHRKRSYSREFLASLLWQHNSTAQSRAYLRRTLWQLKQTLKNKFDTSLADSLLHVKPDWIQVNPEAVIWLDLELFERGFVEAEKIPEKQMNEDCIEDLQHTLDLYEGDLLENYYQEWCLTERERFRHQYLVMLDKITNYYESRGCYETALTYAEQKVVFDRVNENTHMQLMKLRYYCGDKSGAIRQYEQCVRILQSEYNIKPSNAATSLYHQICKDQLYSPDLSIQPAIKNTLIANDALIFRLRKICNILQNANEQLMKEIAELEDDKVDKSMQSDN